MVNTDNFIPTSFTHLLMLWFLRKCQFSCHCISSLIPVSSLLQDPLHGAVFPTVGRLCHLWRYLSHCSKHLDNISIFLSDDISVIDFLNFRTAPFLSPSLSYSALQMVFLLLLLLSLLLFPQQQTRIFYGCRSEWFEWWPT